MKKKVYPTIYTFKNNKDGHACVYYLQPTDQYNFMTYGEVEVFKVGTGGVTATAFAEQLGEYRSHLTPNVFERRVRSIATEQAETQAALDVWRKKV